jgi:hypothetical protein
MLLRPRARLVAILVGSLIIANRAIALAQWEVAPSADEARKKLVRDIQTETTDCVGSCSGSVSCCKS